MVKITLYTTTSQSNSINKTLTNATDFEVRLKDQTERDNLVVKLKSDVTLNDFNYAYIPEFKRYYFINSIEFYPNGIYILTLQIDVLETYKNDILNGKGEILNIDTVIEQYKSSVTLPNDQNNIIMVTIGGV